MPARGRGSRRDTMSAKQIHDAAAYLRGLATMRGRNAEWAERAVRESVSLSAHEALQMQVIDLLADDRKALLQQLDGRSVTVLGVAKRLETANAEQQSYEPDWRTRLLAVITNPSVAMILMLIGLYGVIFEFSSPGMVAPGVIGGICLLLAMFAFQWLPVNYAGLGLILLGIAFIVAEAFLPSFGILGIGGVAALAIGAVMLIDTEVPGFAVPMSAIVMVVLASLAFVAALMGVAWRARQRPVVSGRLQLIGATGALVDWSGDEGWAQIHGELWRVRASAPMSPGTRITVTDIDGSTLTVVPRTGDSHGG